MKYWHFFVIICVVIMCSYDSDIAKVGRHRITSDHLDYMIKIEQAYENDNSDSVSMLFVLLRQKLQEEIAAMNEIIITPEMLRDEADRFERETKAAIILGRIKDIYKNNTKDYFAHFVRPVLVARLLEEKFFSDTTFHTNEHMKSDYTEWFQSQALKVPVSINDPELKQKLIKRIENNDFWRQLLL